ncbi:secreted phosphoprotein 24-like [Carcharodon carcharias]|uniref:secreted phosphoprotein 24-like n=1 Tax=Carcharodon carcharias TaxID=13397 RepID=UPI001B7EBC75|nr:secreted phosphoprotein 24-like [Carcharodon carcharias]
MKSFLLTIAAVQILHCSGVPNPEDALRAAVMKLNEISEISHLCRTISSTVTDLSPTGKFSYNVDLAFSVKETVCSKNSGLEFDDSSCSFRPVKIAETASCRSRVKYLAGEVLDVDVECHGFKRAKDSGDLPEKLRNDREAFRGAKDQRDVTQGGKVHGKPTKVGKGHRKHPERFTIHGRSSELINSSEEAHMTSEESSVERSLKEHNDDSRGRH